jgi:lipoprotein-anchoring transpeptidase ErfK/SrfK
MRGLWPAVVVLAAAAVAPACSRAPASARPHPTPVAAVSGSQAAGAHPYSSRIWYRGQKTPEIVFPGGVRRPIRSLLDVQHAMTFGDYVWDENGVPPGPLWVRIDIGAQLISVFRGEHEIGTAVILYGGNGKPTPIGAFHVQRKAKDYVSHTYDTPMPFALMLTNDGVAIHASNVRPGWATHGCIGVPIDFAKRLFDAMRLGDSVLITSTGKS